MISTPLWLTVLFSNSFYLIIPAARGYGARLGRGCGLADVTEISGVNLRSLAIAVFFFAVNIATYLIGSNLIGLTSDRLGSTSEPGMLRYALLACPAACVLGGLLCSLDRANLTAPLIDLKTKAAEYKFQLCGLRLLCTIRRLI